MSDGKAKWHQDLCLVRERIDGRAAALQRLIEPLKALGLMDPLVEELELTRKVLGECANTVNNSIQGVATKLNEMGYELEQLKRGKK